MKYLSFIFENESVKSTVVENEAIVEVASNALINANIVLEDYIYANLARFTAGADSLADIYENIRNFVISENVSLYSQFSEILSDNELSPQQKVACFYENETPPHKSSLAKKIAMGALGIGALGAGGAYLASAGLLGHDAENYMTNVKNSLHGAHSGFNLSKSIYDLTHPDNNNAMDRTVESLKGAKMGAKIGWDSQGEEILNNRKKIETDYGNFKNILSKYDDTNNSAIDRSNFYRSKVNMQLLPKSNEYNDFVSKFSSGRDMVAKLTKEIRNSPDDYHEIMKKAVAGDDTVSQLNRFKL